MDDRGAGPMRIPRDVVMGVLLLALAGFYFWQAQELPVGRAGDPGPALFPYLLTLCLVVLSIWLIVKGVRARHESPPAPEEAPLKGGIPPGLVRAAAAIALTVGFIALFLPLGFVIATGLYALGLTLVFRRDSWVLPLVTPVVAVGGLYLLFGVLLNVRLPLWPA